MIEQEEKESKRQRQMDIVYNIVKSAGSEGIMTQDVKIIAMRCSCSCADRYLRWLKDDGLVWGRREWNTDKQKFNRTFTWYASRRQDIDISGPFPAVEGLDPPEGHKLDAVGKEISDKQPEVSRPEYPTAKLKQPENHREGEVGDNEIPF